MPRRPRSDSLVRTVLSAATARDLMHYDGRSGLLTWRVDRGHGVRAGDEVGSIRPDRRIAATINGRTYLIHRVIWLMHYGEWPTGRLTFRDGDPQNLKLDNLIAQEETYSQSYYATYQRQHRQKRRRAINLGILDARR